MKKTILVFLTTLLATLLATIASLNAIPAWAAKPTSDQIAFRDLYKELVEINTTLSAGSCTKAANAMAKRLSAAGIAKKNIHVIVAPEWPKQGNLVAAIPGTAPNAEAVMLLAHIDVVEANPEDWIRDPFTLIEEDGYFYGRGTSDDKAMAAIFVDLMIRMSLSGYQPERTVKLVLTCGEETPNVFNGASYLLKNHRDLMDAKFAINEGGGGRLDSNEGRIYHGIQAGEKTYQDFQLEITNPGGHSSRPREDNAIYQLASALGRIAAYTFPVEFNDTTRSYFERMSKIEKGPITKDMLAILKNPPAKDALARVSKNASYNSILRTTCVTTMLDAGHAPNALPQRARANVNCRIFPGHKQEEIRQRLEQVIDDSSIAVSFADPPESTSPPPPLTAEILEPVERLTQKMWPGVPVLPAMIAGGTDGRFLTPAGIPTYGISGIFSDPSKRNAHGLNERMRVRSLYESREFLDQLIKIYVGGE